MKKQQNLNFRAPSPPGEFMYICITETANYLYTRTPMNKTLLSQAF